MGQSANTVMDTTPPARMGFALYDGPAGILDSHFAGFEKANFQCFRVRCEEGVGVTDVTEGAWE